MVSKKGAYQLERMNRDGDRTTPAIWEKEWEEASFNKYYGVERYLAIKRRLHLLFKRFLTNGCKGSSSNTKVLEIGCARGKQLIYFAKDFGYKIYGIDSSQRGVAIAMDNLKRAGVQGTILCEDIFKTSLIKESFDIVYSMGLVEHFDKPEEVIDAHIGLLRKGGILIITVPNFGRSIHMKIRGLIGQDKALLPLINQSIMDKQFLAELMQDRGVEVLYLDYMGMIELTLGLGKVKNKVIFYPMLLINQIIGYLTFFMPSSRYLSPYLVVVARKEM